jgi:hypothetical protein
MISRWQLNRVLFSTTLLILRKLRDRRKKKRAAISEMLKEVQQIDKQDTADKKAELKALDPLSDKASKKNSAEFDKAHRDQLPWPFLKVCYDIYICLRLQYHPLICMIDYHMLFIL